MIVLQTSPQVEIWGVAAYPQRMHDPLVTYLHDHLAGAVFAINLLEHLRDQSTSPPFVTELLVEIEEDRGVLRELTERLGAPSNTVKEAAAWVAEKMSRLKLRHPLNEPLGTLEALETLALGILGKRGLWHALEVVATTDPRLQGLDFDALLGRAGEQHATVEKYRIQAARDAFCEGAALETRG